MTSRAPSLLEEAARFLSAGPRDTLEVGSTVLGLRGPPGAISAAVFHLLGSDPRFEVDGSGSWRLAGRERPGAPLDRLSFAVVDVETTGGSPARGHRITEVAIVPVDDGIVGEGFQSLVNPGCSIPPVIQGITGITDRMVADAPYFEGIAPRLDGLLRDRIFVAHNVSFDWRFIARELHDALGDAPEPQRLCTVRLGRLLVPRLRSYGLDSLTRHFDIRIHDRHRAYGDALATARLLLHLLEEARERGLHDLPALVDALASGSSGRRRASARDGGSSN